MSCASTPSSGRHTRRGHSTGHRQGSARPPGGVPAHRDAHRGGLRALRAPGPAGHSCRRGRSRQWPSVRHQLRERGRSDEGAHRDLGEIGTSDPIRPGEERAFRQLPWHRRRPAPPSLCTYTRRPVPDTRCSASSKRPVSDPSRVVMGHLDFRTRAPGHDRRRGGEVPGEPWPTTVLHPVRRGRQRGHFEAADTASRSGSHPTGSRAEAVARLSTPVTGTGCCSLTMSATSTT